MVGSCLTPAAYPKKESDESKKQQPTYWVADLIKKPTSHVVVGEPLTFSQAVLRVSQGGSVMCKTEASARCLLWIGGYRNYVGPEVHGEEGFYPHFHPTRNHTGYDSIHIWYYE